jgi:hypothetical protein
MFSTVIYVLLILALHVLLCFTIKVCLLFYTAGHRQYLEICLILACDSFYLLIKCTSTNLFTVLLLRPMVVF